MQTLKMIYLLKNDKDKLVARVARVADVQTLSFF